MIYKKMGKITLSIIKPDAVKNGYTGPILFHIMKKKFKIIALKMTSISKTLAIKFYEKHKKNSYFESLVKFMSSGPIISIILEKENAVKDFRMLIGDKNPINAKKGTIRKLYANSLKENAIHGSDSNENVFREYPFYFSKKEIFLNF
ncbi:nucleoside-diphosphate kinase [Blattabacterium cuenoti]|uniref:nucleoside-diphosphate kinase n=1 Tax=Blattabacterium cuenoti TaxID=1653831 RepID=UPI00163B7DE2|nr:nucleoside-diphosphate kinase [Blattabacterium cuenoti]